MRPRTLLRAEGAAGLVVGLYAFFDAGGPVWLLLVLALAPDLSMAGYLAGTRIGATTYNVVHTYVLPLGLGAVGVLSGVPILVQGAAVWFAHIGADRLVGYGLKYPTGFSDTHLGRQPDPTGALATTGES